MILSRWLLVSALAAAATLFAPLPGRAQPASTAAGCPPAAIALDADRLRAGLRQAQDHGFLWRIVKDGRTSYLYGTLHAARPAWMFPGPRTTAAFEASEVLALELDVLDSGVRERLIQAASARPDETLPTALAARLEKRMAAECVDVAAMRAFVPEFQIASLAVMAARREGLDPSYAIDLVLALLARDLGKATASLETPEAQIAALRMPTRAATIDFVTSGLDELDARKSGPLLAHMASAWTDGNLSELEGYERWCDCLNTAAERASMKRLVDDRNPLLAAAIDKIHSGGRPTFAATGSLHMIGARGLPALMRERGYVVEQVRFDR
ncbi:MAG TPA: TraB/GumN family protein [Caldimonas sp.]|nr:TraB/GumN family protein [Caldimonas sp.]